MKDPFVGIFHKGISDMIMENATFSVIISYIYLFFGDVYTCNKIVEKIDYKYVNNDSSIDPSLINFCIEDMLSPLEKIISVSCMRPVFT